MRRRLALTGKIKLPAAFVDVHIEEGPPKKVRIEASRLLEDLKERGLRTDSQIVLEAYRGFRFQRFECGTLANPGPFDHTLDEPLATCDSISGRLKIVCPETARILGEVPRLLLFGTGRSTFPRESLLPVVNENLGNLLFKVDFQDDRPKLCVNRKVDYQRLLSDVRLLACVLQESVRAILMRLIHECGAVEGEKGGIVNLESLAEDEDWKSDWLRYFKTQLGWSVSEIDVSDPDAVETAVDEAVEAFMRRHGLTNAVLERLEANEA